MGSLSSPGDALPHLSPSGTCRLPCMKWVRFAPAVCWGDGGPQPFQGRRTLLCLWTFIPQREGTRTRNTSALGRAKGGSLGGTEQAEPHTGGSILSCGSLGTDEVLFSLMQNCSIAVASLYNPLPPGEGKAACCRVGTRPARDFPGEAAPAFPIPSGAVRVERKDERRCWLLALPGTQLGCRREPGDTW